MSPSEIKKEDEIKKDEEENKHVPIKQPCILIFDSLNTGSRARVVATLRDYIMCEYKAKKGEEMDDRVFDKDTVKGNCPKVPQQLRAGGPGKNAGQIQHKQPIKGARRFRCAHHRLPCRSRLQ